MATTNIDAFLVLMYSDEKVLNMLCEEFADLQLSEIATIEGSSSPLTEFPPDQGENIYRRILKYCMDQAPRLTSHMTKIIVRPNKSITPTDVLRVASAVGQLCYLADRNLNGLAKLRALTLQAGGLTNDSIDVLAKLGISSTSRAVCQLKDMFADIGPEVLLRMATKMPTRRLHDNVDWQSQHMMLECIMQENFDTSNLSTVPMPKEEALRMITPEFLLLNSPANASDRSKLISFVCREWASVLAKRRKESAAILGKLLPRQSKLTGQSAMTCSVSKLYACRETLHCDMLSFLLQVQVDHLEHVAASVGQDPAFRADLALLQDIEATVEDREAAEVRVHKVNQAYGEMIGHGDLMTVETWQVCKGIMAQSVTAFGRGEFLGPYQMGGLHSKMNKIIIDCKALIKRPTNFQDECSVAKLVALVGKTIHNDKKQIVKSDSTFERHSQMLADIGKAYGLNLWDNYLLLHPDKLAKVKTKADAENLIVDMFNEFGVLDNLLYDPSKHDPTQHEEVEPEQGQDDLFLNSRAGLIRFLLSMCYDACEELGDWENWLTVRRAMVLYFLAKSKNQDSKYAVWTLFDVVVEMSSSERTRMRMSKHMVANLSGTSTGGMFYYKVCETRVRQVKGGLRSCHGRADDLLLQKVIQGMTVIGGVTEHDKESTLQGKHGKEDSHDLVGEKARSDIEYQVCVTDPFNMKRVRQYDYYDKPRSSPYTGLVEADMVKFVERAAESYDEKY